MIIGDTLKDKLVIVAEHNAQAIADITRALSDKGFNRVCVVRNGQEVYEILSAYRQYPERISLVILNENLPACQTLDLCRNLACSLDGSVIPFLMIGGKVDRPFNGDDKRGELQAGHCLTYWIEEPVDTVELLMAAGFLLTLKHERLLRYKQEERLINELAEKNIVDAKLKYLVGHDELTGLLNRNSLERQLRFFLSSGQQTEQKGVLLFIDVDRFSLINELEGFEIGDRLLVELVILIRRQIAGDDLFARVGSDEFCLFFEQKSTEQAMQFAENLRSLVENFRFFAGEVCYSASLSIGLSGLEAQGTLVHPSELILRARQACNFAKANGRNRVWIYNDNDINVKERRRDIYWVPLIRKALQENGLFFVFQPVVGLENGLVSHYEVLLRMRGKNNEVIMPGQFIPVAERMGLIHSIDVWVIEQAIDFLASLPSYMAHVSLAINLSSTAFQDPTLLPTIRNKLELTWVDAHRLTFEITETAAVDNFEKTRDMINNIRALGCQFALDDFGAGFCSFNYLKSFPVDYVKIDGQFIKNLVNDETDQILVKSMVEIVAKLGKKTIAEFVESPKTAHTLREMGVNLAQGYYFGKPELNLLTSQSLTSSLPHFGNRAISYQAAG